MNRRSFEVAALLFLSGACALVYQTTWLRELRLVFGASTAASAAVLAIFMGGLGAGGALFGRRADRSSNPLRMYALLETGVALGAAVSPLLVLAARSAYIATGGSIVLGDAVATLARLLLAALVLAVPTVLMGGTLPAAAREVESAEDQGRRRLAFLYGANTLGAVTGALLATFLLLERYGNRGTLWLAAVVNVAVALAAFLMSRRREGSPVDEPAGDVGRRSGRARFIFAAAGLVGFAFFLMEMVWYRMLSPLLGGSTYTFGLILAVALAGIGLGGFLYSVAGAHRQPTLLGFALTCGGEALLMAVPYALGDRVAVLAILLRRLGAVGFEGYAGGWVAVAAIVVFPAAVIAGIQFPMLIGLLGRGREEVGRDAGHAYAWNTAGAIAGALAGGFGILPLLSAVGTWKAVAALLVLLSLVAAALDLRERGWRWAQPAPLVFALLAAACLFTLGPTAAWRHSPIGAGRADSPDEGGHGFREWMHAQRRGIAWDADGVESTVALSTRTGVAFIINGKSDGHARFDAGTQVMAGLLGPILRPGIRSAFVIGLGTGSTAGWLGLVPGVERVDVAELEPAVLAVAEASRPVNGDPMRNPKVHVHIGDAREILLTAPRNYDLIFSEPSNPYRAGVASLFTRDYYEAVADRLEEGGLFIQWLQAYEIEPSTIRDVYRTLVSVFPSVETWQSQPNDLLLIASMKPRLYDAGALRARIATEPFRSALHQSWRAESLEAVLARFVAGPELAAQLAAKGGPLNTDDRNGIEFDAARSVGDRREFRVSELRSAARGLGANRPALRGAVSWERVEGERATIFTLTESGATPDHDAPAAIRARFEAHEAWTESKIDEASRRWGEVARWAAEQAVPYNSLEAAMLAELRADDGSDSALPLIEAVAQYQPAEAEALRGVWLWRQRKTPDAARALARAFERYRTDPWAHPPILRRALMTAELVAAENPDSWKLLHDALSRPFAVFMADELRKSTLLAVARRRPGLPCGPEAIAAIESFEPWIPWNERFLRTRSDCYDGTGHSLRKRAEEDLREYLAESADSLL